ncbi:MAG: tRNA (N6-isopentenyl adenosine(37)-C2)-methylthiotransferase MiaB [Planctomycetota bacterium]
MRDRTVHIQTFGCQMNLADSEDVRGRLAALGYHAVDDPEQADLVLYNTCSVRDHAEARVRGRLDYWKTHRRPGQRIGVLGCMAERLADELTRACPHLALVIGGDQYHRLGEAIARLEHEHQVVCTGFDDAMAAGRMAHRSAGINAWIPVMRGCDNHCTYCIVPSVRGPERSRDPAAIEAEARAAVAAGHPQITLLGQTVDAYGRTCSPPTTLAALLRRLHDIPGLRRLRFVTSHPKDITDELLQTVAELPRVARHLHIPAQSGSSRILRRMGRRYTREGYLELVERARRIVPEVELLSDFIVGFPGETDEDHAATRSLMEQVGFDGAFVFMYSPRPKTAAARMPDDVPHALKRERCNELIDLQLAQQETRHHALIGSVQEILVEGPSKNDPQRLQGRTAGNRMAMYPHPGHDRHIGELVRVRIDRATNLTLFGEPVA